MDTLVENTGVAAEQEKPVQSVSTESEKPIQVPIENAETASDEVTTPWEDQGEPEKQIRIVRTEEKPDPLGRRLADSPLNEIKAGYDYAFGRGRAKR